MGRKKGTKNIDYINIDYIINTYLQSLKEGQYTTIRHLYYKVIGSNPIDYHTLDQHLTDLRNEGRMDDSKIADYTRKRFDVEASSFYNREDFIKRWMDKDVLTSYFSMKYWEDTKVYFELWIEKEAVSSTVQEVCENYKIPVFISKGFCSVTWIKKMSKEFKERVEEKNQKVVVMLLTDKDVYGERIAKSIEKRLKEKVGSPNLDIQRIGLTEAQVRKYGKEKFLKPHTTDSWEIDCLEDDELKNELELIFQGFFKQCSIDILAVKQLEEGERSKLEQRIEENQEELENLKKRLWSLYKG